MSACAGRGVGRGGRGVGDGRRVDAEGLWGEVGRFRVEGVGVGEEGCVEGVWYGRYFGTGGTVVLVDVEGVRAVSGATTWGFGAMVVWRWWFAGGTVAVVCRGRARVVGGRVAHG